MNSADKLDGGVGGQVDLLENEDIITMVLLAKLEGVIARHRCTVSKGLLGTTEGERKAAGGDNRAQHQGEEADRELHVYGW